MDDILIVCSPMQLIGSFPFQGGTDFQTRLDAMTTEKLHQLIPEVVIMRHHHRSEESISCESTLRRTVRVYLSKIT
jgi:hypothetical protein